jgi:hypothetical protein
MAEPSLPITPPAWGGVPAVPVVKPTISGFGEVSYGAKFEILGGSKYEVMAGTKNSVLLGMDNKMSFGAKTDISAGSELKISLGPEWSSPKTKWWPAKGFMAKYDFSTIKEHKLVISKDGSTDILVKKLTMAKNHFQASAGYGFIGDGAYNAYTGIVSSMIKTIVFVNTLLQALNIANGLTVNPAANKQIGFDITNQARASWIPIAAQLFSTCAQLVAAVNVVLSRDFLKKSIMPNSVLQLSNGNGSFLGNRSSGCLTGLKLDDTIKLGIRKPDQIINQLFERGVKNLYQKGNKDEIRSFYKAPQTYFEAAPQKAVVFSKTLEIHANMDQDTKVRSDPALLDPPNILIKADGDSKAKIVAEANNITIRTGSKSGANVKLVLNQQKNKARLTIDKAEKNGVLMDSQQSIIRAGSSELKLDRNSSQLTSSKKGLYINGSSLSLKHGSNRITLGSSGISLNGNLVVR